MQGDIEERFIHAADWGIPQIHIECGSVGAQNRARSTNGADRGFARSELIR